MTRTFAGMRTRLVLGLALTIGLGMGGCGKTTRLGNSSLTVIEPDGSNPLTGRSLTIARAYFQQTTTGSVEDYVESPIENGTFDLAVPIASVATPIMLRVELSSASGIELVGGTPSYYPAESSALEVLVGVPGTCSVVAGTQMSSARSSVGAALVGSFVLLSGGVGAASSAKIDAIDGLTYASYTLTDATTALGITRSVPLDRTSAIVFPAERAPYIHRLFDANASTARPEPTLHAGAATADAVVAASGIGVAVVGGGTDAAPSNQLTWVGPRISSDGSETLITGTLMAAARNRAATFASGLWVASSDDVTTTLEQVPPQADFSYVRIPMISDGVRRNASLVFDREGTTGLLFGGVDQNGVPRTDTVAFTGCDVTCVASPGPAWTTARTSVAIDPAGILVGGSTTSGAIERIRFAAGGPVIEPYATLVHPRLDPAIVRYPSGVVVVFGGADAAGPRSDVEICFPAL